MEIILTSCENPGVEFELQPTLRGSLVELRPLQPEDFEALHAAASDPLVWEQHPEPTRYRRDVFQKFFDGAMESKGAFAAVDIQSGKIIGSSRYYDYNAGQREVTVGYTFLARAYWGRSYNREMKLMMLSHAFRFVDRVLFQVGENNLRSQIALRRIGAQVLSRTEIPGTDGTLLTYLIFGITR